MHNWINFSNLQSLIRTTIFYKHLMLIVGVLIVIINILFDWWNILEIKGIGYWQRYQVIKMS